MKKTVAEVGSVYPSVIYEDAAGAIDWLVRVFGFQKRLVVPGPEGQIIHSELSFGTGVVMVCSPRPDMGFISLGSLQGTAQALSLYVADPDAHYNLAVKSGAEIIREIRDEEYGGRGYAAKDPEGHFWYFGSYIPGEHWTSD